MLGPWRALLPSCGTVLLYVRKPDGIKGESEAELTLTATAISSLIILEPVSGRILTKRFRSKGDFLYRAEEDFL